MDKPLLIARLRAGADMVDVQANKPPPECSPREAALFRVFTAGRAAGLRAAADAIESGVLEFMPATIGAES